MSALDLTNLDDNDLLEAYLEIEEFWNTGVLKDGLVRKTTRNFSKETSLDVAQGLRIVTEAYYREIARRWANNYKR